MTQPCLCSADLQRFIDDHHIQATILPMAAHTPTVADAARELAVETEQVIKSLVFLVAERPHLVINNGLARVDSRKLAARLAVSRRRIKLATPDQALAFTGYMVGSMPPFGHRLCLPTLVDASVAELTTVYGGGGNIDAMLRLTAAELLRVTGAQLAAISQ